MVESSTRERFKRNASGIAATAVTGTWLAAMFLNVDWWLPLLLFGYIVVVPVVSMLFDEEEGSEWLDGIGSNDDTATADADAERESTPDALERLRTRYANGDLTDEQFERKVGRLLETETPEDAAEWVERRRDAEREGDSGRWREPGTRRDAEREGDAVREREAERDSSHEHGR